MAVNPDRLALWPLYFDGRSSRAEGRRVAKAQSVLDPNLDAVIWAARKVGLSKLKRDDEAAHPKRPWKREGRVWVSRRDVARSITGGKEALLAAVGKTLRQAAEDQREEATKEQTEGSTRAQGTGGARKRSRGVQDAARRAQLQHKQRRRQQKGHR